jgi:nucleotide-binding universal stress UspA family protein
MSFKSLLVHVDLDDAGDGRVRLAAELAGAFGAHLIGVSGWAPRPGFGMDSAAGDALPEAVEIDISVMKDQLKSRGEAFRALAGKDAKPEWRSALDLPTELMVRHASSADLLIVGGSRHPILSDPYRAVDPGAVVLRAGRPVLVVPPTIASLAAKQIAVAWRNTREARRAVRDALPFLQRADNVAVVEFRESPGAADAHPEGDVADYLRRHGVASLYQRVRPVDVTVPNSLLRFVADEGIDLIVAGGYGHSRLGEWIFGGVTHDLLASAPVCCLLSH